MTHLSGPTSKFGLLLLVVPFLLSIPKERQRQLITGRTPTVNIHREYYMAARRYEISLRVFQHKKFRTIFLKWLFFAVKGLFYCVATATVIFSRVNTLTVVTCIFTCEDIMISCESSNGISLVFILGLQARDMLVINTINNYFLRILYENGVTCTFPEERSTFVLNHQHGRRDVKCKPALY